MAGPTAPPRPPFLFLDAYPFDFDNPRTAVLEDPPWSKLLVERGVCGVILKATDGVQYAYTPWFTRNFQAIKMIKGESKDWNPTRMIVGGYHYTQFFVSARAQAEAYVRALAAYMRAPTSDNLAAVYDTMRAERVAFLEHVHAIVTGRASSP